MTRLLRFVALGAAAGFSIAFLSCSSGGSCSNCAGCCDVSGTCLSGNTTSACGTKGASCVACMSGQACMAGSCNSPSGGGGGSSTGGGSATGGGGGTSTGGGSAAGGGTATGGGTGTGGGSATGGGSGGGGGCITDGGVTFDGGTSNITFAANCPTFTPCGGALDGTWHYTGACIPDSDFAAVVSGLEQYCGNNTVTLSNKMGTVKGGVSFGCSYATRKATGSISLVATITGSTCGNTLACGGISSGLSQYGFQGSCSLSGSDCVCDISTPVNIDDSGPYTTAGNTLTLTNSNRTFDYCVSGSGPATLTTRETTAGSNTKDPGYPTLAK